MREIGLRPTTQVIWPDAVEAFIGAGEPGEAAALVAEMERSIHEPVTAAQRVPAEPGFFARG